MSLKVQNGTARQLRNQKARPEPKLLTRLRNAPAFITAQPNWFSLLAFALATIAFTWPLAANLSGTLFDLGDPVDSSWRLGSMAYQLLHNPWQLYQSPTLYPVPNVLTLDELLTGNALLTAPLIWLTNNPVLAFNLLVFASYVLSGWAAYLLTRQLTNSVGAGLVAGTIFTFSPWHYAQHGHLGIGATEWMVFALYFLLLFLENRSPRRLVYLASFSFFLALQALVAGYLAYFATIIVTLYLLYYFLLEGGLLARLLWYANFKVVQPGVARLTKKASSPTLKPDWPDLKMLGWQAVLLVGAGSIALLLILPFTLPFIQTQHDYAFTRSLDEIRHFSTSPNGLRLATDENWLVKLHLLNKQAGERALWPGLIAMLLAGFGLFWSRQIRLNSRRWLFGLMAIFGLVLCFGPYLNMDEIGSKPTDIALPYLWFYNHVPGFDALRVPYRFGAIFMLGLAVCAGYGVAALQRLNWTRFLHLKLNWNVAVATLVLILAGGEFYAPGLTTQAVGMNQDTPPLYQWLASPESQKIVPENALMLELPLNVASSVNSYPLYALYNLQYRRPLLDGSANIVPNSYNRLFNEVRDFPDLRSLDVIEGLKVQFVIVHPDLLTANQRHTLDGLLSSGERFDTVKSYPDALLLKVKTSNRFAKLLAAVPPGSEIYLADDGKPKTAGLYTNALIGILGNKYQYFSDYQTLYNPTIHLVQPHKVYDFAILYKGTNSTGFGYSAMDMIFSNETVEVYARANPGLNQKGFANPMI